MDKNSIWGFVLIAVILIGFSWWSQPSKEEQRAAFVQDSLAQVAKKKAADAQKAMAKAKQKAAKEKVLEDTTALSMMPFRARQSRSC